MDDVATVNNRLEHMGHEFRLTGRTACIRMETDQDHAASCCFTDDTFTDSLYAVTTWSPYSRSRGRGSQGSCSGSGPPATNDQSPA